MECDPNKKELIVKVGDEKLICPKEGGNTTFPGYKGILECPRYIDFCPENSDKICNEIFSCLTLLSIDDNYKVDYSDYDGNEEKEDEEDEKSDEYIAKINTNKNSNINLNLFNLILSLIYLIN